MSSIVQSNHAYPGTGVALTGVVAGNVMLVTCSWNNTAGTPTVSDTQGNTYTQLQNPRAASNFTSQTVWYAPIGTSGNVTVNVSGGFSDMGLTIMEVGVGGNTTGLIVASSAATGAANPQTVTLQGYKDGIAIGMYANESTPITAPSGNNLTQLRYDSGHADWQGYNQLTSTGNVTFGYNTSTTYNNQNYVGVTFGKFVQPTRTHTTDAMLRKATTRTHTADAATYRRFTPVHTVDGLLKKLITKIHTTDAYLLKAVQKLHTTDVLLRKILTRTHTSDLVTHRTGALSHATDIYRVRRATLTHTTNSLFLKVKQLTHTTDAYARPINYKVKPRMRSRRQRPPVGRL